MDDESGADKTLRALTDVAETLKTERFELIVNGITKSSTPELQVRLFLGKECMEFFFFVKRLNRCSVKFVKMEIALVIVY